ncbi:HIT family protein, partial [Nocardia sp. JMUB6875]|uniref:HIT family protein n=1 Tax=Nocardia sp. JMUB6875 TaxID=3158170 RepID=UPI0034E8EDF2
MDPIESALRGENPTVIRRMTSGFAVFGDTQFLPGYCLLLSESPTAEHLSDLPAPMRRTFLSDMALLGEAVERACTRIDPAFRRINLEILGNTYPRVHAHIWPRYTWEPPDLLPVP